MSTITTPSPAVQAKRLNFNVSEQAHLDLSTIAKESNRSMTDIIRLGIALARIALEEQRRGHKLVIANADGVPLKELVLP